MKRDYLLIIAMAAGLTAAAFVAHWNDGHRRNVPAQFAEEQLYVNGAVMKRIAGAFSGIAADWYWMRSLQYVGRKIVTYEDTHAGKFDLMNLSSLDLRLLPSLLRMATTLDPQFLEPYYYGALILPDLDGNEAIALLNQGIAANPEQWKLYQHLGYIHWQRREYQKAGDIYDAGAKLPGAPAWMFAMGARMKAEGGAGEAAREMYAHLYETSDDVYLKGMVERQLMQLDSVDERAKIRQVLSDYAKSRGRCAVSWKEVAAALRAMRVRLDAIGEPTDPSNTPYRLITGGCDVDVDDHSPVPHRGQNRLR
jgi:tetratricopeptide (TPR) repeat protein